MSNNFITKIYKNAKDNHKSSIAVPKKAEKAPVKEKADSSGTSAEKTSDLKVDDGLTVKVVYNDQNGSKTFKNIIGVGSNINYNISPSGKKIVICDTSAQNIMIADADGKVTDVTQKQYTDSHGTAYPKDSQLKLNPQYVWCSSPKFIDDDNIAYLSQLPWFNNQSAKYVWVINTKNMSYNCIQDLSGNDIKLDKLTDKGLTVIIDGNNAFLKSDGSVER